MATHAGAVAYLHSLGIDPASVVIQRGARNYAGPKCPGAGWNCTTSYRVFQIATSSAGGNTYSCKPQTGGSAEEHTCVIVQTSPAANNTAACKITFSATASPVNESCSITQTNESGTNRAELKQELTFSPLSTSEGTQQATVMQTNGSGANVALVNQKSSESISNSDANVTWSQSANQDITIDQDAVSGANSVEASQEISQTQQGSGATSGSQSQFADQQASIDQSSSGAATLKIKQSETQVQTAADAAVTQSQVGPQDCCSEQIGTPATAAIKQLSTQTQDPGESGDTQTEQQTVTYSSTGNITGTQTSTQDGESSTNSFSGSSVSEVQGCSDGTCTTSPVPENWVSFFWTGGDDTTADGSPFSISNAESGPVVMSVTDGFCRGDRFTLSEGETTLGTTSSVPVDSSCSNSISDPAAAWADPTYSRGSFALTAGSHSIDIVVSTSPFGSGEAFYSVDPMTAAHCTGSRWATFTYPTFTSEADCLAFAGVT